MDMRQFFFGLVLCCSCSLNVLEAAFAQEPNAATPAMGLTGTASPAPYVAAPYTCATNYYVDPKGKDTNTGTSWAPWRTVTGAIGKLTSAAPHPGVCVNVNPGTYTESIYVDGVNGGWDGTGGYLVFRSSVRHAATLQEPHANIWSRHNVTVQNSRYVIFDGFNVVGYTVAYAGADGLMAMRSHHIKFLNNNVHNVGGTGIASIWSDYIYAQGNVVYNTACCSSSGASAIAFWEPVASDTSQGFHNVISSNIVYNNSEGTDGRWPHTEGHGVILDSFRLTGYGYRALIENNLIYGNGGLGINAYLSSSATIRNNTVYHNCRDPLMGYNGAEIAVINSSYAIVTNNITVADISKNIHLLSLLDLKMDGTNFGNVWTHNLTFNGNPGQPSVSSKITAAAGNILGKNPLFVDVAGLNFRLQAASPASGTGTAAYGVPRLDLSGNIRSPSVIDMGAFALHIN
jgi:serralysin